MTSGQWAAIIVMLPLLAAVLSFIGGRALLFSLVTMIGVLISVSKLAMLVWANGPQYYTVSGWAAPLGIEWYADGLSVLMLLMTALVNSCIIWYALRYFKHFPLPLENLKKNAGKPVTSNYLLPFRYYLPIWLLLWSGLNALFLSADLFNLYITLEIVTLAVVPLIILSGSVIALRVGMRYLLISITASMFYLLGIALLYGAVGTLDIASLANEIGSGSTILVAMFLIILGLIIKTALFPFHFWLPTTYSYAPAPVSALLSALVIKSTFYLLLRLWFEVNPREILPTASQLFGILGTIAIAWGSWQALQQQHLKPLIAYSTVAQVGYFFILFPLASGITDSWSVVAFQGGIYLTLSHAFATAALFMVAGNIQHILGTDNLNTMHGFGRCYPLTLIALAIAGVSIIGLPPSGGFLGNWLLLKATYASGQWWWAIIIVLGGLLAIAYVWKVLRYTLNDKFTLAEHPHVLPITMKLAPLLLAMMALILGTFATPLLNLLEIGAPF